VFEARQLPASPLYILLHSWQTDPLARRFLFDVAVNIAIYIPLGASAYLTFRRFKSVVLETLAPIVLGALLSASVEMAQLFTPTRTCSAIDLVDNMVGSALGVLAGYVFTRIVKLPITGPGFHVRDRSAVSLLFVWVAFLTFPLFPVLWLAVWKAKFLSLVHAPLISPVPSLLRAAEWFAVGRLLVAAGAKSPWRWLFALLLLVPAQFAILNHNPIPADFMGAALGALLFQFSCTNRRADGLAGFTLLFALILRGLSPFHFGSDTQAFLWVPFGGFLATPWQDAISILTGKLFQYGASLWLLHRAGLKLLEATVLLTLVLVAIEALQTRIPGHVPEITDPLLALMLCLGLRVLESAPGSHPRHR
jgi:VanZ family protein